MKGRKRKRDGDGEAGRHHLSAQSLVQQVTYNGHARRDNADVSTSAGVAQPCESTGPSSSFIRQLRARVSAASRLQTL